MSQTTYIQCKIFGWLRQSCKSGRAFRVGPGSGLSLSKCFGTISGLYTSPVATGSFVGLRPQTKHQTPRPVARFQDLVGHNTFLGGQDFCFYYMFETNFSGRNQIWADTKEIWGALPSNAPPRSCGPANPQIEK